MFHRSWGLMFIHRNISAPCTLLDFPTREGFVRELTADDYDIVGISGIVVNVGKVREMCRLVRLHSPHSTIVVGGHVTSTPGIERTIDADHIARGEGVAWMRAFLGEDPDRPLVHPLIPSSFGFRMMGVPSPRGGGSPSATIVPSVGCPLGCNFCTTSAFFGGKGRFVNFYQRGEGLFRVMCDAEREPRSIRWSALHCSGPRSVMPGGTLRGGRASRAPSSRDTPRLEPVSQVLSRQRGVLRRESL